MVLAAGGSSEPTFALREVEPLRPGPGQVLVDVRAAAVTAVDRLVVQGWHQRRRPGPGRRTATPWVPGRDVAGRVAAVGPSVAALRPGDEVFGWCDGAYAEQAVVAADRLVHRPARLTPEQAAVLPTVGTAALRAVRDAGRTRPGQHVLVLGASGGVGTIAVQVAKALGATVTGVCSTTNCELVRSVGADRTVDYTIEDVTVAPARFDVIVDLVGDRSVHDLRRSLRPMGTLVLVAQGSSRRATWSRGGTAALLPAPPGRHRVRRLRPRARGADLEALRALVEAGSITPVVSAHYPLAEVGAALGHFAPGHARGTIAITVR